MAERLKALVLKTKVLNKYHGFESHFIFLNKFKIKIGSFFILC